MESNTNNNNDDLNLDFNQEIKDNNNFMSNDDEINFDLDENKENNENNNKINNLENNNNDEEGNDDLNKAIHEDDDLEDEVEDANFNLEEALKGNDYNNKKSINDINKNNINSINVINDDDNVNKINVINEDDNVNKINVVNDDGNVNKINVVNEENDNKINVINNEDKNEENKNENYKNENYKNEENKNENKNEENKNEENKNEENKNEDNKKDENNNNNNDINNNNIENESNNNEHEPNNNNNNENNNDNNNNENNNDNNNDNNIINNKDKNIINNNNEINTDKTPNIENIPNNEKKEENNIPIEPEKSPEKTNENQTEKVENKEENFNILQTILNTNDTPIINNTDKTEPSNNPNSISSSNITNNNAIIDDASKTTFQIQNTFISQITIHKTQNSPETRAYISSIFSPSISKIIVIGGTDKSCNQFSNLTVYDPNTNSWETKDDPINFSKGISGHSSNLIFDEKGNEHLFIFGGYTSFTNVYTNHVFIVSLKTFNFNQIDFKKDSEQYEYPLERSYHTSNYDRDKQVVYVYGGTNMNFFDSKEDNFNSVWEFDIKKNTWKKNKITNNIIQEKYSAPRGHSCLFMNKKLIVFGGVVLFKKFHNEMFAINTEYDKDNNFSMEQIFYDGFVPEIAFHSAEIINKNFFVVHGGLNKNYNVMNDFYVFDVEYKKFDKIEIPLIPKLFGHKILNANNSCLNGDQSDSKIYFVGGVDNFKFVGDENMIIEEESENINEGVEGKNEGNKQYQPMKMIMQINFNI